MLAYIKEPLVKNITTMELKDHVLGVIAISNKTLSFNQENNTNDLPMLLTHHDTANHWDSVSTSPPLGGNMSLSHQQRCDYYYRLYQFRIVIDIFFVGIMCVFGLIGNTISILVLRTDNINKMVSFLLQALAVADNAYLITCLFMQTLKAVCDCTNWIPNFKFIFPYMERYIWPSASIAQMTAVWLVVLVTLDRYMAICRPFDKLRGWITLHAKKAVIAIPWIAFLYNLPRFFEQKTIEQIDLCAMTMRVWSVHSDLRLNKVYFIVYKTCMFFIFRMIIPMSILVILNGKLIQTLREAKKDRAKLTLTQANPKKDSFTLILVSVVSVFIICQTPDFVLRILVTIKHFAGFELSFHYAVVITNMLLTMNSSINCVIYCLTGRRFRCILKRLLCRPCSKFTDRPLFLDEPCSSENASTIRKNKANVSMETASLVIPPSEIRFESKC